VTSPAPISLHWKPVPSPGPVTLRGRYVTLEPLDSDRHTHALWDAVREHDEVWTWLSDGPYECEVDLYRALAEKQASTSAVFFAILPEGAPPSAAGYPAAAGYANFMRIEPAHGVIEVGNILLSPRLQRTRAATEAMYLMAEHIFDHLLYRRYEWKCNALNEPSRRAALRLGFSFEGIFRQHMVVKDRSRDTAWFSMLDSEWPDRKRAFEAWLDPANFDSGQLQVRTLQQIARHPANGPGFNQRP
jgi:RimJ/RimL family protein N-acetyltransferase